MGIIGVAVIIDVMKAASLGFVTPGMQVEYGLTRAAVSVLPYVALIGTTLGSFLWGALADFYGRRASLTDSRCGQVRPCREPTLVPSESWYP
jgi:MFS transporter, putative metabolite:H+ symporter